jgi:hypothetical protein
VTGNTIADAGAAPDAQGANASHAHATTSNTFTILTQSASRDQLRKTIIAEKRPRNIPREAEFESSCTQRRGADAIREAESPALQQG